MLLGRVAADGEPNLVTDALAHINVESEDVNRRASDRRQSNDLKSRIRIVNFRREVRRPIVGSGIEQPGQESFDGIDPRDIRVFLQIASHASERKIVQSGHSTVLFGQDVLYVKSAIVCRLRNTAVFAMIAGAVANRVIENAHSAGLRLRRALSRQ